MNKKGNIFFGFAIFLLIFVMGTLFLPYLTDEIVSVRDAIECDNADEITSGTKLTCLNIGALVPFFIWFFVSVAASYLLSPGGSRKR